MASFIKNTMKLLFGSLAAQAVAILLIPVITRIYSPEDFGVFQLFISISGTVALVSCLSYQFSIMLPKKDTDAANITVFCFMLLLIISLLSGILIIFFSDEISSLLNTPELKIFLCIAPVVIFLNGAYHVLNYWLSRRERYGTLAFARLGNSSTKRGVQVSFGLLNKSPLGLISGTLFGFLIADIVMFLGLWKEKKYFSKIEWSRIKYFALRYKKFPKYTNLSALSNQLSLQMSPFMLAFFFSPVIVGFYSIANQVVNLPASLIGSSISQVFFQKASCENNRTGEVRRVVQEVYKRLFSLGIFPMLLLIVVGEELFSVFLGIEWFQSGVYARIMAPWFFMVFISSPLTSLYSVLERQDMDLLFNILLLLSRITALYLGGISGNPYYALILFSGSGVMFWAWMNHNILKIANVNIRSVLFDFIDSLKFAGFLLIPVIIAKFAGISMNYITIIAVIISFIYYALVVRNDSYLREKIMQMIKENHL